MYVLVFECTTCTCTWYAFEYKYIIFKASQPRGRASGSRAYGRYEMQGVIIINVLGMNALFVNLRPHLLRIRSRHQFSSPEKNPAPTAGFEPTFIRLPDGYKYIQ